MYICFLTVRLGSKRLKNKQLKKIGKLTFIEHILCARHLAKCFTYIIPKIIIDTIIKLIILMMNHMMSWLSLLRSWNPSCHDYCSISQIRVRLTVAVTV